MSRIFDALLRAEAERDGTDGSVPSAATELLERAERHATAQRHSEPQVGGLRVMEYAETDPLFAPDDPLPGMTADDVSAKNKGLLPEEKDEIFSEFQTAAFSLPEESRLVSLTEKESPAAEAFRLLGVRLRNLRKQRPLQKILITSTVPQEGKSMTAANLACTLASGTSQKVLLLEGDVRRPALTALFKMTGRSGICDWLEGERSIVSSIYRLEGSGFWILPAGRVPDNPLGLIQSSKLPALLEQLTSWFDWIVIDSPPVLPMADTSIWARFADGILLVARHGITQKRQLQRGVEALDAKKLIGAVMNSTTNLFDRDYYYYGSSKQSSSSSAPPVQ
jgi:capsular exopolysaccharide synthesis family protein